MVFKLSNRSALARVGSCPKRNELKRPKGINRGDNLGSDRKAHRTYFKEPLDPLSCICVLIIGGCSCAPVKPKLIQQNDFQYAKQYLFWMIKMEMRQHDVKGLSIAIVDDQIIKPEGAGRGFDRIDGIEMNESLKLNKCLERVNWGGETCLSLDT